MVFDRGSGLQFTDDNVVVVIPVSKRIAQFSCPFPLECLSSYRVLHYLYALDTRPCQMPAPGLWLAFSLP